MMQPASGSRCVFGFTVMALVFGSSLARGATSTISGLVTDPTGARLPGVAVTATNEATNVDQASVTNADGVYVLANLPTGQYRLTLQLEGFRRIVKPGIEVHVQDTLGLNFQMELGSVIQSVTVESGAPLIETRSGALGTVITRNFVENIPLNGRSLQTLIGLAPGVVFTKVTSGLAPGQFSVNGQRTNTNYFTVDGVSANVGVTAAGPLGHTGLGAVPTLTVQGGTNSLVPADAVEEFRIQTSTFAPEFGRSPGAQVSIVTRSGGNDLTGSVFEYFRNDALDATDWFNNAQGLQKPALRQNDFGGVLGGPLLHDRTFFFASYEGLRLRLPQSFTGVVPSLAARQNAPAAVQPYVHAFPRPTGRDVTPSLAEYAASYSDPSELDTFGIRVDHGLASVGRVFFRYSHSSSATFQRGASSIPNSILETSTSSRASTAAFTSVVGSHLAHELRVNYSSGRAVGRQTLDAFGGGQPPAEHLLFPSGVSAENAGFTLNVAGLPALRVGLNADNDIRHWNVVDSLSWFQGTHQLKIGADYRLLMPTSRPLQYSQFLTFTGMDGPGGLLGGVAPSVTVSAFEEVPIRASNWSLFAQDQWQVTRRMSLLFGARWDLNTAPRATDGLALRTFENLSGQDPLRLAEAGTPLFETRYGNVAPRASLAYELCRRCDLVVRGGWGRFFDATAGSVSSVNFPYGRLRRFTNVPIPVDAVRGARPEIRLEPPFGSISVPIRQLRAPYTDQWNATLEKAIGRNSALLVSYVGARGRHLLRHEFVRRPNGDLALTRNTATSDYRALQLQFRRRLDAGLQVHAAYAFARAFDVASTDTGIPGLPGSFDDPQIDRGPADFDVRHSASVAATYQLGQLPWRPLARALDGWSIEGLAAARSATPVNVGATFAASGYVATLRPNTVPGADLYIHGSQFPGGRIINRAAFVPSTTGRQGSLGRNALRGFPFRQIDLAFRRAFALGRFQLHAGVELFNAFNMVNFGDPVGTLSSPLFGRSTSMLHRSLGGAGLDSGFTPLYHIGGPRSIQLSLRVRF